MFTTSAIILAKKKKIKSRLGVKEEIKYMELECFHKIEDHILNLKFC